MTFAITPANPLSTQPFEASSVSASEPLQGRALTHWLAVGAERRGEPAGIAFVTDVMQRRGFDPQQLNPAAAEYRLLLADRILLTELGYHTPLDALGGQNIEQCLKTVLALPAEQLAWAIWATDSFTALKALLLDVGALVRYSHDLQGLFHGHVVPAAAAIKLIEQVEQGQYLNAQGELATEAIPSLGGLRRKVLLLDYLRREQQRWMRNQSDTRRIFGRLFS